MVMKEKITGILCLFRVQARKPLSNGLSRFGHSAKDMLVATLRRRVLKLSSGLCLAFVITTGDIA